MRWLLGWFAFALGWAMLAEGLPAFAQPAQTVLRFNQFTPRTHFYYQQVMEPWIDQVAKATGGRVKIEVTTAPLGPHPRAPNCATRVLRQPFWSSARRPTATTTQTPG